MVSEVPSFEEFFGLNHDGLTYTDWVESKEKDTDVLMIINAILIILQEFYNEHRYDTPKEWLNDSMKKEFNNLNKEIYTELLESLDNYIELVQEKYDAKYKLPYGKVEAEVYYDDIINSGVDTVVDTLYNDIRHKADFYNSMTLTTGIFTIEANFRRAIKRLSDIISNNAHHGEKIVERKYLEFVYGEDALFDWIPSGINTCPWCYAIAEECPLPLSSLPVDHINGRCSIVPHYPDKYSTEYVDLMGWLL